MTTASTSNGTTAPRWQTGRDWLLGSLFAVFLLSLIAAHLPPSLMPIVMFPIGFSIVCGIAISKCAEIAGVGSVRSRGWLHWLPVVCLLLAGFAHVYWIVFSRYVEEAREDVTAQNEERQEQEQIVAAISAQGQQLDEAGVTALLQPPARLPTFFDYLEQRVQSDRIPEFMQSAPWPITVFTLEITLAIAMGAWVALEGIPRDTPPVQQLDQPPG